MLGFTGCFLYAMESLLVLRKGGEGDVAITLPFFLPCRFFAVSISACRSFSPLLLYSSSHRVRLVDVTRCSTHRRRCVPMESWSVKGTSGR